MRVFKNVWFQKFARKEKISDASLCEAVARAEAGLIDADLGGGVIKQRVARPGSGRSGGYRTILFFRAANRAVFVFGFAKNARQNLEQDEETAFRKSARFVLDLTEEQISNAIKEERLTEINCGWSI